VTFGSFNRPGKISESSVDLWSRVLHAVPGSSLLIARAGEARTQQRLRARFQARGIEAERLSVRPPVGHAEFLAIYNEVDIALDTLPYTGSTTTHHALWMGVPVLTLAGSTPQQDQSAAILDNLGMSEWVTRSPDDCVELARKAAADLAALDRLRQGLRPTIADRSEPAKAELGREMDRVLQTMWRRWCAGLAPESFAAST
jgi:predicted O-linked N-acetylglucosamine transferase (SPINDLY family)